jgi:hypothetical protein
MRLDEQRTPNRLNDSGLSARAAFRPSDSEAQAVARARTVTTARRRPPSQELRRPARPAALAAGAELECQDSQALRLGPGQHWPSKRLSHSESGSGPERRRPLLVTESTCELS